MAALPLALVTAAAMAAPISEMPECRCVPPDPCWSQVPWKELNASVSGRLRKSVDELASCLPKHGGSLTSDECAASLESTDDEFWLSAKPNGFQHTGLFNEWNISSDISEYSVLAETEADFQATVKFAADHNLRKCSRSLCVFVGAPKPQRPSGCTGLVVKGTGHDWYGRSTAAGSLLLWTHQRKEIAWHDSFVAEGCEASSALPAATVQSGVQFMDL